MNTTLLSILCGAAGMVGWGIYDFLGGVFAKEIGPIKSYFWSQLAGLISVLLLAIVLGVDLHISPMVIILFPIAAEKRLMWETWYVPLSWIVPLQRV